MYLHGDRGSIQYSLASDTLVVVFSMVPSFTITFFLLTTLASVLDAKEALTSGRRRFCKDRIHVLSYNSMPESKQHIDASGLACGSVAKATSRVWVLDFRGYM